MYGKFISSDKNSFSLVCNRYFCILVNMQVIFYTYISFPVQ